jgi:hypothetical protein
VRGGPAKFQQLREMKYQDGLKGTLEMKKALLLGFATSMAMIG